MTDSPFFPPFAHRLFSPALALLVALFAGPTWAQEGNLCLPEEKVVFACAIEERLVSVCASPDLSRKSGYLQFRSGHPERIEIAWPEARYPRRHVTRGNLFYAGQIGVYLRFTMGRTDFVVFSAGANRNGVVLQQDGAIRKKNLCKETEIANFHDLPVPVSDVIAVSGIAEN